MDSAGTNKELNKYVAVIFLVIVAAAYIVNAMDRQVFPVLLKSIDSYYGISLTDGGLLATIFTIGLGISGYFAGALSDKTSRKTVMLIGIAIYSLFTLATALAVGFYDLLAYRILGGFGEGFQNAALFAAVGTYFARRRALAIGFVNIAYGVGLILGPLYGGKLAVATGHWQTPFYYYALIGAIFFVIVLLVIPKKFTEKHPEYEPIPKISFEHVPETLFNRNLILIFLTIAMSGFTLYAFIGLYPTFLINHLHFNTLTESYVASFYGYGVFFSPIAGYIATKINSRAFLIVALIGFAVNSYLGFNVLTTETDQIAFAFFEGMFASGVAFVLMYALIQRTVRPNYVGRASGLFVIGFYLPSAFSGYIFADLATKYSFGFAAIVQLVIVALIAIIPVIFIQNSKLIHLQQTKESGT